MNKATLFPDVILESSWEVCNKVGGIYTVLSTRAKTLTERLGDNLIFIGPDVWKDAPCPYFREDKSLLAEWKKQAATEGLAIKTGRWDIPGNPVAVLVNFSPFFEHKNDIYAHLWEDYQVDSLHAYGDYDEASMFSYAAGKVVESYYRFFLDDSKRVVYHANEWMTGLGALYINKVLPQVATIFTTHATSIGRSICGNNKPLYNYLPAYNGDQMSWELNMQSKHSIEKQTALHVDCFTTVSDITATECRELLDKECDVVLPNGFDDSFVAKGSAFTTKRRKARKALLKVANCLTGIDFGDDTVILSTSGRYEYRNKGIDVFIDAVNRLRYDDRLKKRVVVFVEVPGWTAGPRTDLQERLNTNKTYDTPLDCPTLTHSLHNFRDDNVMNACTRLGIHNGKDEKVTLIFMPCYLTGNDGILNLSYYDTLPANDLCVYASYYEPWGYTPLEAIAFHVPCVVTDLSGFALWANSELGHNGGLKDGVKVIHRDDYNYDEVAREIEDAIVEFACMAETEVTKTRNNAFKLSKKALWQRFIAYYYTAYDCALRKAEERKYRKQ
jgi:glycosyltransferase involved in cell wall biosynthesis